MKINYIKADIGVRYWNDAEVNGEEDIDFMKSKGEGKTSTRKKEMQDMRVYLLVKSCASTIQVQHGKVLQALEERQGCN